MGRWSFSRSATLGGRFRVVVHKPGQAPVDISYFRGVPVVPNYSSADPFSDATATLNLPQLTAFDDLDGPEVGSWLGRDSNVDIWWIEGQPKPPDWIETADPDTAVYRSELTGDNDSIAPAFVWQHTNGNWVKTSAQRGTKVWEGYIASIGVNSAASGDSISVQCVGALFQADGYLAKPTYPPRPQTLESLIAAQFDHGKRPHLRTSRLAIEFPAGWTYAAPAYTGSVDVFTPNVKPGKPWTGYTTRQTGSWDHALTGFIQSLLATMLVKSGSGVTPGNQWTLLLAHEDDPKYRAGRTPVLRVRDRFRAPDFALWAGTPGLTFTLTADDTQREDAIYGSGTDLAGTAWNNLRISPDGSSTDYAPVAAQPYAYPVANNALLDTGRIIRESYVQYGAGFSEPDARDTGEQTLGRDSDTGWSGNITLGIDPPGQSRWTITAGMTMALRGFMGTGTTGLALHVAQVEADPSSGSVTLTVDTRYRDLLTLNEALERTRDNLTPAKLLELNKTSITIEDLQAPWNYGKGSGFVPQKLTTALKHRAQGERFPYVNWAKAYPPKKFPQYYVSCIANSKKAKNLGRWSGPVRVLMSEKGTIRRTEIACYDQHGNVLPIPFHVAFYYKSGINSSFMPHALVGGKLIYSPFIPYAFSSIDPSIGARWTTPGHEADDSLVKGYGNKEQPAGYSPGVYAAPTGLTGNLPTGLLIDETAWAFDCSANNPNYVQLASPGKETAEVVSVYAMFYADYVDHVYFSGRLFRQEPGTDGT